jgi:predicted ATPase with chaperone activity
MLTHDTSDPGEGVLAAVLADEAFWPTAPRTLNDTGLPDSLIESLICKFLASVGPRSGRDIADHVALPFGVLEDSFQTLRTRQILRHAGAAPLNDYTYALTDHGNERAQAYLEACAYIGPAPVPLSDYVLSAEAQAIRGESPRKSQLEAAFDGICVDPELFAMMGPAINSGAGLFLYGEPGNGKSTLAKRITRCFSNHVWVPQTLIEDNQLIKLYDPAYHTAVDSTDEGILKASHDRRWKKIRRPVVIVGGELTMEGLEIRHDPRGNVSEAPLQLKSNCGLFLVDDFGRQRIEPRELLNRWIVPLENGVDYLTLATGKKIEVPFEQLIIFSTNLDPGQLVDEAFLRRIPYKINISDPSIEEFHELFQLYAPTFGCEYRREVVDYVLARHYKESGRPPRRCHPRDLLKQVRNFCVYNDLDMEMRPEYFDRAAASYFTVAGSLS